MVFTVKADSSVQYAGRVVRHAGYRVSYRNKHGKLCVAYADSVHVVCPD